MQKSYQLNKRFILSIFFLLILFLQSTCTIWQSEKNSGSLIIKVNKNITRAIPDRADTIKVILSKSAENGEEIRQEYNFDYPLPDSNNIIHIENIPIGFWTITIQSLVTDPPPEVLLSTFTITDYYISVGKNEAAAVLEPVQQIEIKPIVLDDRLSYYLIAPGQNDYLPFSLGEQTGRTVQSEINVYDSTGNISPIPLFGEDGRVLEATESGLYSFQSDETVSFFLENNSQDWLLLCFENINSGGDSLQINIMRQLFQNENLSGDSAEIGPRFYVRMESLEIGPPGLNWASAFTDPQEAIENARAVLEEFPQIGDCEVRIAAGTYKPQSEYSSWDDTDSRAKSFLLYPNIKIRGGYPADGGSTQDFSNNKTIFSGDIDNNDDDSTFNTDTYQLSSGIRGSNVYHVIKNGAALNDGLLIEGLVISGGDASIKTTDNPADFSADYFSGAGLSLINGNITIKNCHFTANRSRVPAEFTGEGGAALYLQSVSPLIENCDFTLNLGIDASGGAVLIRGPSASPQWTSCTFTNNQGTRGGAIFSKSSASGNLQDSSFSFNSAAYGGALFLSAAELTAASSSFTNHKAQTAGGAVYIEEGSSVSFTDCPFSRAEALEYGGILAVDSSMISMQNSSLSEGVAEGSGTGELSGVGGALFSSKSIITISGESSGNSQISGNSAANGGAVFAERLSQLNFSNLDFDQNTAADKTAGALFLDFSLLDITDCTFTRNTAASGGACNIQDSANVLFTNTVFGANNNAAMTNSASNGHGGALIMTKSSVEMINSSFYDNNCNGNGNQGGAVYAVTNSELTLNGCRFQNNSSAAGSGGAMAFISSILDAATTDFISNSSPQEGGAIYSSSSSINLSGGNFSQNSSDNRFGGALSLTSSNLILENYLFTENTAPSGGACYFEDSEQILLSSTDFGVDGDEVSAQANQALSGFGGAIYMTAVSAELNSCRFFGNNSSGGEVSDGGALYAETGSSISLVNSLLKGNQAINGSGGGLALISGSLTSTGSNFTNNISQSSGGALFLFDSGFNISGGSFTNNETTGGSGGAIWSNPPDQADLADCALSLNKALSGSGGALYTNASIDINISNCSFSSNQADDTSGYGGAYFANGYSSHSMVSASVFTNNSAGRGGALHIQNLSNTPKPSPTYHSLRLENSRFTGNQALVQSLSTPTPYAGGGGGAVFSDCPVYIDRSYFGENAAPGSSGGALRLRAWSDFEVSVINNSTFYLNTAGTVGDPDNNYYGGAAYFDINDDNGNWLSDFSVHIFHSAFIENLVSGFLSYGGGLYNTAGMEVPTGPPGLVNSYFFHNQAQYEAEFSDYAWGYNIVNCFAATSSFYPTGGDVTDLKLGSGDWEYVSQSLTIGSNGSAWFPITNAASVLADPLQFYYIYYSPSANQFYFEPSQPTSPADLVLWAPAQLDAEDKARDAAPDVGPFEFIP